MGMRLGVNDVLAPKRIPRQARRIRRDDRLTWYDVVYFRVIGGAIIAVVFAVAFLLVLFLAGSSS
jgi:hypothetical protein